MHNYADFGVNIFLTFHSRIIHLLHTSEGPLEKTNTHDNSCNIVI